MRNEEERRLLITAARAETCATRVPTASRHPANLPQGIVSFLFTDIEGSTRLWEEHPQAMQSALAHHDRLLRTCVEAHGGLRLQDDRRWPACRLRAPDRRAGRRAGRAAGTARHDLASNWAIAGAHGHPHRYRRAARRRLLWPGAQSRRAPVGGWPRRPDPDLQASRPIWCASSCRPTRSCRAWASIASATLASRSASSR